jgi:hypothetical protein
MKKCQFSEGRSIWSITITLIGALAGSSLNELFLESGKNRRTGVRLVVWGPSEVDVVFAGQAGLIDYDAANDARKADGKARGPRP